MRRTERFTRRTFLKGSLAAAGGAGGAALLPADRSGEAASDYPAASPTPTYVPLLASDQRVTITFENYNLASAGAQREGTLQLLKEFAELYPNIAVEQKATPLTDILASVQTQAAAGKPPDVAQFALNDLDFAANQLGAKPLESLIAPEELARHYEGYYPKARHIGKLNGQTYSVPYVISMPTLFYNADLLRAAGLDADKPPATWAEVKQYGVQIREKTGKSGIMIQYTFTNGDWVYQGLVHSNGGRVISEDRTKLMFAEPNAVGAVVMWQDLVKSGAHPTLVAKDAQDAFGAGNLAMYITSSAQQVNFLNASKGKWELRAGKLPAFAGKPVRPGNSGAGAHILANDPLKQRAAWELVKFLTSPRGFTVIASQIGYLPLRPAIIDDPQYLKDWAQANAGLLGPNLEQLDNVVSPVPFPGPNYQQINGTMMEAVENVIYYGADAQDTLEEAQSRAQELMPGA